MDLLTWPELSTLTAYYAILGILALFGMHRLALLRRYRHHVGPSPVTAPKEWPTVTVQLPLYNERFVAERLIDAVCRFDYPTEHLEIQVLDDSTDDTSEIVARRVASWRRCGIDIQQIHRVERRGFKAGALDAGAGRARGDFLAVFDADFVPPPDFLRRAMPSFSDPGIGMVQARWGHLNRQQNLLTRVQSLLLDGHFLIEHTARSSSGCFFNFNGTAGVWRRATIAAAGGWQHDTLTEDLDLSYRAQIAGWRFAYLPDLVAPAELPGDIDAFKSQQHRWAKGSAQTARKLLPLLLRARLPGRVKVEATIHLLNNSAYLLMVALSLLAFPAMALRRGDEAWTLLAFDLPLFTAATLSVVAFYLSAQVAAGRTRREALALLPALMATGIGLSLHNAGAVLAGLVQRGGVFHRTPKTRAEDGSEVVWTGSYRPRRSLSFLLEGVFAVYLASCLLGAVRWQMWSSIPFLLLFFSGYLLLFSLGARPLAGRLVLWQRSALAGR